MRHTVHDRRSYPDMADEHSVVWHVRGSEIHLDARDKEHAEILAKQVAAVMREAVDVVVVSDKSY